MIYTEDWVEEQKAKVLQLMGTGELFSYNALQVELRLDYSEVRFILEGLQDVEYLPVHNPKKQHPRGFWRLTRGV
jgi:hypothetical protein